MTTSVAKSPLALTLTSEETDLIKREICRGATDAEIKLFLYKCQALGVNPLLGQAHLVPMHERDGDKWVEKKAFIMGVDGFAARAAQHPDYLGCEAFAVCEKDEFLFDTVKGIPIKHIIGTDRGAPVGAWARLRKSGERKDVSVYVRFVDYVKMKDGHPIRSWLTMPAEMVEADAKIIDAPPPDSDKVAPGHIAALCARWGEYARDKLKLTSKDSENVRDTYLKANFGVESKKDLTIIQFRQFMEMIEAGEIHHGKRAAEAAPRPSPATSAPTDTVRDSMAKALPAVPATKSATPQPAETTTKRKPLF